MGVSGLKTIIQSSEAYKHVSIEKMAKDHESSFHCSPVLVVDGSNFIPWFYAYRKDSLEGIYGGQWIQFKEILEEFVLKFQTKGIKLVFIFDGTICEDKLEEWAKRRMDKYKNIDSIFRNISENLQKEDSSKWVSPALKLLAKFALKELEGVDVHQTDKQVDADNYIADYANKHKEVFAILSDDSDFIILDTKPVLLPTDSLDQLETYKCDRKCFAESYLNISPEQLPLFACLMSNDYVPFKTVKGFHRHLVKGETPFNEVKVKKICKLIRDKKWNGDVNNKNELSSISKEVGGGRKTYDLIERGLKSYIINSKAVPLTPCEDMSSDFKKVAHEKHFDCSHVCIFNLLCMKEYGSSEVLEDGSKSPSALVYREIRQRCYGLLFNCFVDPNEAKPIVIKERCWYKKNQNENNDLTKPEQIGPLPLRDASKVIKIEDLWFNCTERRRFEIFWNILEIPMEFDLLMTLPEDQVALSCILNYLIGGKSSPLLDPLDVAVFVAQAAWKPNVADIKQLENPQVHASAVNLSTLFISGIEPVLMALETCGFTSPYKYALPWKFFDGKLFHFLYNEAKRRPKVRILCNNEEEIIERFYQLLPVVTNNTDYDPRRFKWRGILKDFKKEQKNKS